MKERIALLPGDGVGPEVTAEAVRLLDEVAPAVGLDLEFEEAPVGGQAIDLTGSPLPEATFSLARGARAVLLGAVGGPRWDELDTERRPEAALLGLRKGLELYANLRPVRSYKAVRDASPIKHTFLEGIDMLIVRELTGGVYFGEPRGLVQESGLRTGFNTMVYNEQEVQRIARVAFDAAMRRRRSLTSVDKANVLETSRLWRQVVSEVGLDYPEVQLRHLYVDNCAMQIIIKPAQFDVILTSNLFGDILSDEASVLGGSIGLLPSASLGPASALYEPIHGSAPDIAGRDAANPIATMLSAAMMLRHSLGSDRGAEAVERAVENVLDRGYRTADLAVGGRGAVGTREMGRLVREETMRLLEGGRAAG